MTRGRPPAPDEGTARFAFQAAVGLGSCCTLAALWLGLRHAGLGAWVFLVLALLAFGVMGYTGRRAIRLRRARWQAELEAPNRALDQLFARAAAERKTAAPPTAPAVASPREDADHA